MMSLQTTHPVDTFWNLDVECLLNQATTNDIYMNPMDENYSPYTILSFKLDFHQNLKFNLYIKAISFLHPMQIQSNMVV
jgi:hypothetical protein